jgi:sec-independent protein translocase protein TatB
MLGKAQRYVADVKAEVNRSIELDELKKMKTQFEDAARDVEKSVHAEVQQAGAGLDATWSDLNSGNGVGAGTAFDGVPAVPQYKHPKKRWRLKRGATPQWYKQRQGIRTRAQSGAARVARFRPPGYKAGQ